MIVVSDTTPLISLLKIRRLDLLQKLFGEVHVPRAVFAELTQNPRFTEEAEQIRSCPFLTVAAASEERVRSIIAETGLDLGESEAIVLAESLGASLTLIDEIRARAVAKERGLRITGTVGILDRAFRLNYLTAEELRRCAQALRESGRYISGRLLDGLLSALHESSTHRGRGGFTPHLPMKLPAICAILSLRARILHEFYTTAHKDFTLARYDVPRRAGRTWPLRSELGKRTAGNQKRKKMILCVEDDTSIRDLMIYALNSAGFEAKGLGSGKELFDEARRARPRLIMLDIMLPGEDGIEILKKLRSDSLTADIPVIMATAKGTEYDKAVGLDLGADDYLAKPFGMMEMVSRVRAVLRRSERQEEARTLKVGRLSLSTAAHSVTADGRKIQLTLKEFEILRHLMENLGMVLTRDRLLETVWGMDFAGETRTVDVHIGTLRTKLGPCGDYIETVRGVGYRMEAKE